MEAPKQNVPQIVKVTPKRVFGPPPPQNQQPKNEPVEMKPVQHFPAPNEEQENVEEVIQHESEVTDEGQLVRLIGSDDEDINNEDYDAKKYGINNYFPKNDDEVDPPKDTTSFSDEIGKPKIINKSPQTKNSNGSTSSGRCDNGHSIKAKSKLYVCNEVTSLGRGCNKMVCPTCISEGVCSCGAQFAVLLKNKIVTGAIKKKIENTHNISRIIAAAIPKKAIEKIRVEYLDLMLAKYDSYKIAIKQKKENPDLSCGAFFSETDATFNKNLKSVMDQLNFKNIKINVPCSIAGCIGGLVCAEDKYSCDKCGVFYCFKCHNPSHEKKECGPKRGVTCAYCTTISVRNGQNLYCIGCFTFYNGRETLPDLTRFSIDLNTFPPLDEEFIDGHIKKNFFNNYKDNKETLGIYIDLYNKMIDRKNQNLFNFLVENVLCGYCKYEECDAEIINSTLSVSDKNAFNKVLELQNFLIEGFALEPDTLKEQVKRINKLFMGVGNNKKDLINDEMKIRAPAKVSST